MLSYFLCKSLPLSKTFLIKGETGPKKDEHSVPLCF